MNILASTCQLYGMWCKTNSPHWKRFVGDFSAMQLIRLTQRLVGMPETNKHDEFEAIRSRTVAATWKGSASRPRLVYAMRGHPEHPSKPMRTYRAMSGRYQSERTMSTSHGRVA
jgi:hypothetical protein